MNDDIQFHPPKFKNTYRHWMENVRDWCISRQLWWGHRIPAWYGPALTTEPDGNGGHAAAIDSLGDLPPKFFVAFTEAEGGGYSSMEQLATIAAAAQRGFPRSKLAKFAKDTPDRLARAGALSGFSSISSWILASEYVELLEERPPLFPVVVDSKSKRFAKELSSLLARTSNYGGNLTRRVQSLLTRYEAAKATR